LGFWTLVTLLPFFLNIITFKKEKEKNNNIFSTEENFKTQKWVKKVTCSKTYMIIDLFGYLLLKYG